MQVLVNCDDPIDCDQDLIRRVEGVIEGVLEHFGDRISRVEARLSDIGGRHPGDRHKLCSLEARICGAPPLIVKHAGSTLAEAIHGAASQLQRFLVREMRQFHAALDDPEAKPSG